MRLTTVVCVYQTDDRWPDEAQHDARPAIVEGWSASGDSKDVVSARLDDVVDDHHVNGECNTEDRIERNSPPALCCARHKDGVVGIQCCSQIAHDARQRTNNTDGGSDNQLDFDIAKAVPFPPGRHIVCRPEKSIDEVEEIAQDDPKDQSGCGQIAALDMPDDGRDVEHKGNERQQGYGNRAGRRIVGVAVHCACRQHGVDLSAEDVVVEENEMCGGIKEEVSLRRVEEQSECRCALGQFSISVSKK